MANFTTNENLYKWSPTDTKTETITEMAKNADKLEAKFAEVDTAITTAETDITNLETGKTDKTGDHLGTWHGLTPELADPGISGVVAQHTTQIESTTAQLADKAKQSDLNATNATIALKADKTETNSLASGKADKTYVDTLTASLASGSPKGTYATLTALQTAFPTGNTNIYVVTADGKWYYWNGSAWTAGSTYQSTGVVDGTITKEKTDFMTGSENLFDKNSVYNGYSLNSVDGNLTSQAADLNWNVSDWIYVLPSTLYVKTGKYRVGFYTEAKTFISALGIADSSKSFTTPENCAYIRVEVYKTDTSLNTYMVSKNAFPTEYVSFGLKFTKLFLLPDNSVEAKKTNFMKRTVNLFDYTTSTDGFSINPGNGLLTVQDPTQYCVSDFIPVSPSTAYIKSDYFSVAFYDANRVYISGIAASQTNAVKFTSSANAVYMRVTVYKVNTPVDEYMVVQGTTLPFPPVPYYLNAHKQFTVKYSTSSWANKKWTSYGDSITAYEKWQLLVIKALGLSHTNRGIGGTTVAEKGSIAYVDATGKLVGQPPTAQPAGSTQILSSFCNTERINTMIPTDAEVITIMGGTNDYAQNVPLGTISDTFDTTFYGGYISMLNKIYARVPNARIILMTQPFMHNDTIVNTEGHIAEDYREATRKVADKFGYSLIEIKKNMGTNELNYLTYFDDGIHPNDSGGKRFAELIIGGLKAIEPIN